MAKFIEVIIPEYGKSVKTLINIDRILKVVPYNNGNESQIFWEVAEEKKQFCEVVSIPYSELIQQLLDK